VSLFVKRGSSIVIALALVGCLKFSPDESDVMRILTELQPKDAIAAGSTIELIKHRCKLMAHRQSHECTVEYRLRGSEAATGKQTPPKTIYLIVHEVDGVWTLYSHRDTR